MCGDGIINKKYKQYAVFRLLASIVKIMTLCVFFYTTFLSKNRKDDQ